MNKILLVMLFAITSLKYASAQNPLIKKWDYRYGGPDEETFTSFQQTSDGGFILGGYSTSDSGGDKSQPTWDTTTNTWDYWVVKLNSDGIKEWDKRFGGTLQDGLNSLQQTSDGGYILGGYSNSPISGDKTQANWDTDGGYDFWIVKIDSLGNKLWDKRYGGIGSDQLNSLEQTSDGGYILGGSSRSDISGDKSQLSRGGSDYWIVKINSSGIKQWDKRFGGENNEDILSLEQTSDGGYILSGWTSSDSSGDVTEASRGLYDFWIVKVDADGNKQWDKRFGGAQVDRPNSIIQTSDGGFISAGISLSDVSGDKSQPRWNPFDVNNPDWWVVKLDANGSKQWDKDIGGTDFDDEYGNVSQTFDGGYLFAGTSYSPISGDKTENNLGPEQTWVVKTNSEGLIQWDKTLFSATGFDDECGYAIQTKDSCYLFANMTWAGIGGYKTQSSRGAEDYWIVKFCDTTRILEGINPISNSAIVFISPNPFVTNIAISIQKKNFKQLSLRIENILGQSIFYLQEANLSDDYTKMLDLGCLHRGIYVLQLTIDGEHYEKEIVKQ